MTERRDGHSKLAWDKTTQTMTTVDPHPATKHRDEIARIIHKHVRSEPDKHFVDRRWLAGVSEAAAEIASLPIITRHVSDADWQRALDCAMSCLHSRFTPAEDISRATMDNAMQHAFGMLSLAPTVSNGKL